MSLQEFPLYVANTSQHNHVLMFSLVKCGKVYEQPVPIGQQVRVLDRLFKAEEIQHFREQKEKYGYRDVKDIRGESKYIGICFSVGSEINLNAILGNYEHNAKVLDEDRDRRMEDSAIALAKHLTDAVSPAPTPLLRASVEHVTEQSKDTPPISVGLEFAAPGVAPESNGRRSKRR